MMWIVKTSLDLMSSLVCSDLDSKQHNCVLERQNPTSQRSNLKVRLLSGIHTTK